MSEIDPAWFYSSLAQASAAIVGLIGAILGSRIIDHIGRMRLERNQIDMEIGNAARLIADRTVSLRQFENFLRESIARDTEAI